MAFDLGDLMGEIASHGLLRTNKFEVSFTPPNGLTVGSIGSNIPTQNFNSLGGIEKVVSLYCERANIPGIALDLAPIRRYGYGPIEKKPFAPTFNDATFLFRADAGGFIWKYLQSWLRLVVNYQNIDSLTDITGIAPNQRAFELSYKKDYVSQIVIDAFDDAGGLAIRTVLKDAYPIFVGDIQMSWEEKNGYVRIPATFAFIDWYHDDPSPIMSNGSGGLNNNGAPI